ncbi:hypothetical protein T10_11284 [Trichinella papuae]|uniref:Uncharacterized protein n=1 Tax=Trichinella papuae TaxID=268474 RepID=A0A0V1MT98_9BILA|nr:hypothetical protein T10_11284 [Trichinella papuae]
MKDLLVCLAPCLQLKNFCRCPVSFYSTSHPVSVQKTVKQKQSVCSEGWKSQIVETEPDFPPRAGVSKWSISTPWGRWDYQRARQMLRGRWTPGSNMNFEIPSEEFISWRTIL